MMVNYFALSVPLIFIIQGQSAKFAKASTTEFESRLFLC